MTSRRVLLVGRGRPERGGISVFLHGLAAAHRPGWSMQLLNLTRAGDMGVGGALDFDNLKRTTTDTVQVWRRSADSDIVHIHSALAPLPTLVRAGLLALAAKLRRRPVVVHAHGGRLIDWADRRVRRLLLRLVLAPVDRTIAVSSGVAEVLHSVLPSSRVQHVANGVDTTEFRPAETTMPTPTILYVGILTERKGVFDLLEASARLAQRGVEHRTVLVGGRPDEGDREHERVLDAIEESTAPVTLVGPVPHDEIVARYQNATVFCLPSWWEAMPLSVLEAMACGLPVVATDVGDVAAVLAEAGTVVAPHDVDALTDALESYLRDPDRSTTDGRRLSARVERDFSLRSTHDIIFSVYEELLR